MLDRAAVFVPRQPPRVEFDYRAVEFKQQPRRDDMSYSSSFGAGAGEEDEVVVHRVRFSREWLSDLKSRASASVILPGSTAHCSASWRTCGALAYDPSKSARPLSHAAGLVSDAVARMNERYFRSFIDFTSSGAVEMERLVPASDAAKMVLSPVMKVYSKLGFPLSGIDFGGGGGGGGGGATFFHVRSYVTEEGLVFTLPCRCPVNNDMFKRCCYSQVE
ncbi:hypothetical protein HU200_038496 [Digitaria exilis]|uniref:Uncharacterized protein n=1 Tax=Digitaria exilis TaxID=1010633 RepID=A0A835EGB5_9POAL|nr:hypothetical protein HU200_038496 [Digitaria exilis]